MDIRTHQSIDHDLCGKPVSVSDGACRVELRTTDQMAVDGTGLVGVISLGSLTLWRSGSEEMSTTTRHDLALMLMAGLFNALAFLALVKALQVASVVYVNALNASQAALAAVAGILFFREALSEQLALGILLTVLGLMLMKRGQ